MRRFLLVTVMLATAAAACAQSDTGRHHPVPAPTQSEVSAKVTGSTWYIGLNFGLPSGDDLFRVRAGGSTPWDPEGGAPFGSSDFTVTLDEGFAYGVSILRDLGPWLRARADATFAQLPMTAKARVGETVRLYEYDAMSVAMFGVGFEARLTSAPSHPYLAIGVGTTVAGGVRTDAYDQTVLAARFGVGYQQVLATSLALRLEICNTMQSMDFEEYRPPTSRGEYPNVTVENLGPQNILGFTAGLVANF
jgi:hypothetical protein